MPRRPSDSSYLSVDWQNAVNRNHPLNRGLFAWWSTAYPFQGGTVLRDLVGRNLGTLTAMDPATDWVTSSRGWGALDFDGVNDRVDLGTLGSFPADAGTTLSVSQWLKFTAPGSRWILGKRDDTSSDDRLDIKLNTDHNAINVAGAVQGAIYTTGGILKLIFGTAADTGIGDGEWHNLIVTYDGPADTGAIYLDGISKTVSYSVQTTPVTWGVWTRKLYWGGFNNADDGAPLSPMPCQAADLRLYTRVLTPAEAKAEYEEGRNFYPGLLNRWRTRLVEEEETTTFGRATLIGVGLISATPFVDVFAAATLTGVGEIAATGKSLDRAEATITGTGAIVATGKALEKAAATLTGTGAISATPGGIRAGAASLTGVGEIDATSVNLTFPEGEATLNGAGFIAAKGKDLNPDIITIGARTIRRQLEGDSS